MSGATMVASLSMTKRGVVALSLLDLKSQTLHVLVEELGLDRKSVV